MFVSLRIHHYLPVVDIAVVPTAEPIDCQKGIDHPPLAEGMRISESDTEHQTETFAVTRLEIEKMAVGKESRFADVETRHSDIAAQIPAIDRLFEIVAVFARKEAEVHVSAID